MKNIKNAILALGVAIALSFGFNTSLNATGFGVEQVAKGSGVIDEMIIGRTIVRGTIECEPFSSLTVLSADNEVMYHAKVCSGEVSFSIEGWHNGNYYIILNSGGVTTMTAFSI